MPFLLLALGVAVAAAVLTGGRLSRVAEREWRWPLALFLAFGIQIGIDTGPAFPRASTLGFALLLASYALLLSFCVLNVTRRGMAIVAVGIALNAVVIAADRGMPAKAPVGHRVTATVKHHPLSPADHLVGLGDVVVVAPLHQALSLGDLFLTAGLVAVLVNASRPSRRLSVRDRHLVRLHDDVMERLRRVDQTDEVASTRSSAASTRGSYT